MKIYFKNSIEGEGKHPQLWCDVLLNLQDELTSPCQSKHKYLQKPWRLFVGLQKYFLSNLNDFQHFENIMGGIVGGRGENVLRASTEKRQRHILDKGKAINQALRS